MITALLAGLVLYLVGKFLVRMGWPRSIEDCAKWGAALYAVSVLANGIPKLVGAMGAEWAHRSTLDIGGIAAVLVIVGLGVLGYCGWHKEQEKSSTEPRLVPRRRALPPPPQTNHQDEHFTIVDDTEKGP